MTPKLYKAGEVCELLQVQPYVLRSWEKEFPGIGVQKSPESARLYRQSDVEHVQRIKQLVFGEGLTVAGARRRLGETEPVVNAVTESEAAEVLEALGDDVRARIAIVRDRLRELHSMLSGAPGASNGQRRPSENTARRPEFTLKPPSPKPARVKAAARPSGGSGGGSARSSARNSAARNTARNTVARDVAVKDAAVKNSASRSKTAKRGATKPAAARKKAPVKRKRADA